MTTPLLEARSIRKAFPGVLALDNVSLKLYPGEVLALVGENGAGKSTLMKTLAGVYTPDAGELLLNGFPVRFTSVSAALRLGISLIHQELNLAENLSVAANLYLGREPTRFGLLDFQAMNAGAEKLLRRVGLPVNPGERVSGLAMGQRQLIEIARSIDLNARVLIMDEPTSSLTQGETNRLFEVIADLKQQGVAIVYISHRLAEVQEVADRAVVLRDGRNAGELAHSEITRSALIQHMIGRDLKQLYPRTSRTQPAPTPRRPGNPNAISETPTGPTVPSQPQPALHRGGNPAGITETPKSQATRTVQGPVRLRVRGLRFKGGGEEPISFDLHGGEVVGMAGLVGAGRTELSEALFGLRPILAGSLTIDGAPLFVRGPNQAIAAGLLLVPEDRRQRGLILHESIRRNIALPNMDQISLLGLLNFVAEERIASDARDQLKIKARNLGQPAGQLSGGNQQKVVLGKWLARQPRVLILDEPTRGVDVGARGEIYALIDQLAGSGVAVLMISSDMEEVLGMSDRVLVLHEGRLTGDLEREKMTETEIMSRATGMVE